ncbi:sigma-54 interaction domain-containing protein [Desulfoscipio geothermicus]|uniref:PAS domain S-box-containing protein n=1 Tax=Desulfoscipio geothermicus DSM 3669 TaxID=1121426 RepID=A0A1I6D9U9_9FIRM|nr:sigma 54-interacting transcriptional regulator [Desulfoscipio geothermicus]SFR02092.1 PAS domain S-box-containing protein [Desulfoscipio geothermicus DSM 3669]
MLYPETTDVSADKACNMDYSAEKILNTIFENSNEGLLVIGENGVIQQVNTTLAAAFKTYPDKLIGRRLADICKNSGLRRLLKVVQNGAPEFGKIDTIDGRSFWGDYIPIKENGRIQGALAKLIFLNPERDMVSGEDGIRRKKQPASRGGLNVIFTVDNIIGNSPQMIDLKETLLKVAPRNSNILITGESGTGKELFAQAIHAASLRRSGPFIKINCAAIPETLLESEFFGYEEGAFTGGKKGGQVGKLELANGGTVFLDEIGDLSFALQAKLLRFIQQKEIQKLGGGEVKVSDVRVVAATNVNLEHMVKYKKFREDLYYRLNVVNLTIPPLRERREDIIDLAHSFIKKFNRLFGLRVTGMTPEVEAAFQKYSWPGNVRELENTIERAFNVLDGNTICQAHLPQHIADIFEEDDSSRGLDNIHQQEKGFTLSFNEGQTLSEIMNQTEKMVILQTLMNSKGNKARAAQLLGISRPGLYKKLVKYNLT